LGREDPEEGERPMVEKVVRLRDKCPSQAVSPSRVGCKATTVSSPGQGGGGLESKTGVWFLTRHSGMKLYVLSPVLMFLSKAVGDEGTHCSEKETFSRPQNTLFIQLVAIKSLSERQGTR
jgi:hypothetical protein